MITELPFLCVVNTYSTFKNAQLPSRSLTVLQYNVFLFFSSALRLSGSDLFISVPDMAVNIECLLDNVPERERDTERKQVRCCFKLSNCISPRPYFQPRPRPDAVAHL